MECIGDQVFSRPVLALQKNVGIRVLQLFYRLEYLFHGGRFADHFQLRLCRGEDGLLFFQCLHFAAPQAEFECRRDGCQHLLVLPGFRDEIGGSRFDSADGLFRIRIGSDQDDDSLGRYFADAFQPVKAFFSADGICREIHIEQDDIVFGSRYEPVDFFRVRAGRNTFCQRAEQHFQRKENVFVVVDN